MSLEILFNLELHRQNVRSKNDSVVCCIHSTFLSNGYKCTGLGENFPDNSVKSSDLMPTGWNSSPEVYALSYRHSVNGDKYILKILNADGVLFVHVLKENDTSAIEFDLDPKEHINDDFTHYDSAFKDADRTLNYIASFLTPTSPRHKNPEVNNQESRPSDNRRPPPPDVINNPCRNPYGILEPPIIGRSDLDPFSRGGPNSGMIYDPLRSERSRCPNPPDIYGGPMRLPRGAIPPGARFDPIIPGHDPFRSNDPDNDEMRRPGFYDDMFM